MGGSFGKEPARSRTLLAWIFVSGEEVEILQDSASVLSQSYVVPVFSPVAHTCSLNYYLRKLITYQSENIKRNK